ncbi:hypothetical protein HPP92_021146 [Vanilla planifolia]|uniref:Uncharacterized protein n=1 Tax=Vanilla planifolia TaxID=51239 RepID=A0A835PW35_VANPL|nr:hypothetical protein HPP92_021146 [Vanilla planifolia]
MPTASVRDLAAGLFFACKLVINCDDGSSQLLRAARPVAANASSLASKRPVLQLASSAMQTSIGVEGGRFSATLSLH